MKRIGWHCALGCALFLLALVGGAVAGTFEIGPGDPWCATANGLRPGDELVLGPGDYQGACTIAHGGIRGAPIVIRAADPERRPRIVYPGSSTNVLQIRASNVTIQGLEFGPTQADVDAVRIISGNGVTVEGCRFYQLGGIAVVANHTSVDRLTVRRNVIEDSGSTGMYFGCHDGLTCTASALLVEGNYIRRVTAAPGQVGYGLEIKVNSSGVVRDNVILYTKGPGIMVYGARDLTRHTLVERNVTIGSRTSSGIVVGGGPAVVRNNVSALNAEAGIGLEDYQGRGLLRSIVVIANTVYRNAAAGIAGPEGGLRDVTLINNAAHAPAGRRAIPPPQPGLQLLGNVECIWVPCFANPDGMDFSPFPGSLLASGGVTQMQSAMPQEDFFGIRRGMPPTVGAIERPAGLISLEPRR